MAPGRGIGNLEAGAFERMLDESGVEAPDPPVEATPSLKISLPGDMPRAQPGGGEARWRTAMAWASEIEARASPLPSDPPGATAAPSRAELAEAVGHELGLDQRLSPEELLARWRDFLWRNHPDRLPAEQRADANVRVAIANALHDQARRGHRS
jgi:hypothetical protein